MKVNLTIAVLFIAFALGCSSEATTTTTETSPANEEVLAAMMAEPKIKDAYINDANVLYVQVADDGTKRDGYAEYLCQVAKDKGVSLFKVRVMKVNTFNDPNRYNAYGVLLGETTCQ